MKRREFLTTVGAVAAAPFVPVAPPAARGLAFHPDAFALTMAPLNAAQITRMDVLFGFASLTPPSGSLRAYFLRDAEIQAAL